MKKIILFVIISLSFSIKQAYGQDELDWKDCVREAKERHPDLISAAEDIRQAAKDLDIDVASVLPQVTSSASGKRGKSASGKTGNTYAYSMTGEQLIFDGFKTSSGVSSLYKTFKAAEYTYAVTSSDIRLDLRSSFVELLKAQELIALTEEIAERRRQNLELVKLRYEAGREHRGSLLTAQADLAQAEFEVAQARRNISLVQRKLTKELGRDAKTDLNVKGAFAITGNYDYAPDFENLADMTPFLKELITRKEAARYDLLSEESDFFPQVYLNTTAGRTGSSLMPRGDQWSAGLSISLPLFEGGSRAAEVSKARSAYDQAKADERSGRDSVLVTLETTWKDLQDGIANVSVKNKFLEAARERAKITTAQYEKGLTSFDDWVIIENSLVNAKKEFLDAQAGMLIDEAYWVQAIGGTLEYDEK
ncbi:MAG: TolC family protein [Candidatus Omnitrophica bacterium]|nr:TolC family protein [Candidatus Omnitrophota bacterium]